MSLDVYVMPLWQFKSGRVPTAMQRVFPAAAVITALGILSPTRLRARKQGRDAANKLLAEAGDRLKTDLAWPDRGGVVFAEQASWGFAALKAYAKWLDLRDIFPNFADPPENNFYKHQAMVCREDRRTFRFSHITDHDLTNGYFLTCRFDQVIEIEPYESWGGRVFYRSLGSSFTLADQIESLGTLLPAKSDLSEVAHDLIHRGFDFLKTASAKSIEHRLPIIFWG